MTIKLKAVKNSDESGEDDGSKDIKSADLISSVSNFLLLCGTSGASTSSVFEAKNFEFIALPSICVVPLEIPPGDHKLQYCYWLWYSRRSPGKQSVQPYDQNLKLIGSFGSVEQFWAINSHLARPSDLQSHSDFHLFKVGIKPMWEDEANQRGGKWIVRLRKGLASRCWENLVLAMLGEQFMVGQEICGAVVSIRFQEDIICVWNRTASDQATTARIRDTMRRVLNLPTNTVLEYKTHNDSLKYVSASKAKANNKES